MPVINPPIVGEQVLSLPPAGPFTGLEAFHVVQGGNSRHGFTGAFLLQGQLDTDPAMTADSNARVPSQHAVRLYVAANSGDVSGPGAAIVGNIAVFNNATGDQLADSGFSPADFVPMSFLDTDPTLSANSNSRVPTQAAVKAYADNIIAAADVMVFKGVIDCSGNPNYPAADRGWTYRVSVAGRIGGALGPRVEAGDILLCLVDASPSGDQATVGANWSIIQTNIDGAVIGPASAVDGQFAAFDGVTGKLIKALTAAQATAALNVMVGDSGAGGTKGLVPAPAPGDAFALRFLRADGLWANPPVSSGDVVGPLGATDNAIARFDGVTGKLIQNSSVTIDDLGQLIATIGNIRLTLSDVVFDSDLRGVAWTVGGAKSILGSGATLVYNASSHIFTGGRIDVPVFGARFQGTVRFAQDTTDQPGVGNNTIGTAIDGNGRPCFSYAGTAFFNRTAAAPGNLLSWNVAGVTLGTVSADTGTGLITYGTFFGSHWSQLADGSKPDILRGTIVESIAQMCAWPGEAREQRLPRFKISDTPSSRAVYGVFAWWEIWEGVDEDGQPTEPPTNDAFIGALGAFVIRIDAGQVVQIGDFIESAGNGCGRVQADDIFRSSTAAKITSTVVAETYPDGSYLVPCTLHCG